eukprot:1925634-Heterocapsa_arctica.AAC.1
MSDAIAEPIYKPDPGNASGLDDWMKFPRCLTKMLRHTGGQDQHARRQVEYDRITDAAGWATTGDISRTALGLRQGNKVAPKTVNLNYMLGVVMDDDKGRFQMAVVVAAPDAPDPSRKLNVYKIHAMRAVSGHSD